MRVKLESLSYKSLLFKVLSNDAPKDFLIEIDSNEYKAISLLMEERPFKQRQNHEHEHDLVELSGEDKDIYAVFEIKSGKSRVKRRCNITQETYNDCLLIFKYTQSLYEKE